jgi:acyl-coenzyme A thioesterase PaaI-like protein
VDDTEEPAVDVPAADEEPGADELLADELRRILRALNERDIPDSALREARERATEIVALLDGPERPRWFAQGFVDGRSSREARRRFSAHSLYRGHASAIAPPMVQRTIELPDGRVAIEGRVTVPRLYEGPPYGVHGGYIAGLFDDILGGTQVLIDGPTGLTGTLTVRYRNLTPLDTELVLVAWVDHVRGRRIVSKATCHAGDVLTAEADALFVRVDMEAIARRDINR